MRPWIPFVTYPEPSVTPILPIRPPSNRFGNPAFPVNTQIHRLAQGWSLSSGRSATQAERGLKRLFPPDSWNGLHLRIIFYGREHCTARGCDGTVCEICRTCHPRRRQSVPLKKA